MFGNNTGATRVSVSADNIAYFTLNPSLAPVVDGLFPTDGAGDFSLPVNPDLRTKDFSGKNRAGVRALYGGSAGGTGYAISWAQNNQGQSAGLSAINFVRVDILSGVSEIGGFSVVPEPTPLILLVCGSLLVWTGRRRVFD